MTTDVQTRPHRAANEPAAPAPHAVPAVDVFEDEAGITVLADLPGVSRDRLGVRVDGDQLVIEGTADVTGPREMDLLYGEAQLPAWRREFTLSRELDASRIEAKLQDGVLRLSIPKAEEARPRRVEVRVG
jgi:HSP20 family molecular chaperone IbpA